MTRPHVAVLLAFVLAGCTFPKYTQVPSTDAQELGLISLGGGLGYVIDPRTETCLLANWTSDRAFAVPVSCTKLRANVPEAARFITWDDPTPSR